MDAADYPGDMLVEILRYVVAHPRAKDTISGIEQWWLSKNISLEEKRRLEKSLDLLVSKGWLNARCWAESGTIYSLNAKCLAQIKEFLEKS